MVTDEEIASQRQRIFLFIRQLLFANTSNLNEVADDLAQEVIIKAITHKDQFRGENELKSWLNSIAVNMVRDYGRKLHSASDLDRNLSGPYITSLEGLAARGVDIEDKILRGSLTSRPGNNELSEKELELAVKFSKTLSQQHAKIFLLSCEGFGPGEISEKLGMNEETVKVMLFRTRKKFIIYVHKHKLVSKSNENLLYETIGNISSHRGKRNKQR